ncbi:MAG TPA: helix-turn-helix domain-containing protein [Streptosporangiaceae bacterium]
MDIRPGYREWAPPQALRPVLACVWSSVEPVDGQAMVLPDACSDLIWQRGKGAFVAGPDTGPAPAPLPAGTVLVALRFRPGAGGSALGLPLTELQDLRVDAADLSPALAGRLRGSLPPDLALRELMAFAGDAVASRPPDRLALHAARLLGAERAGAGPVAAALGISDRQLRRRLDDAAGLGPRALIRVLRFRRFLSGLDAAIEAGSAPDLAGLAADAGYADQAHLTRECGRLSGQSPLALARARAAGRTPALPLTA